MRVGEHAKADRDSRHEDLTRPHVALALPRFGGNIWVYRNWALGLQANGVDIVWLETFPRRLIQGKSEGRTFDHLPFSQALERI